MRRWVRTMSLNPCSNGIDLIFFNMKKFNFFFCLNPCSNGIDLIYVDYADNVP